MRRFSWNISRWPLFNNEALASRANTCLQATSNDPFEVLAWRQSVERSRSFGEQVFRKEALRFINIGLLAQPCLQANTICSGNLLAGPVSDIVLLSSLLALLAEATSQTQTPFPAQLHHKYPALEDGSIVFAVAHIHTNAHAHKQQNCNSLAAGCSRRRRRRRRRLLDNAEYQGRHRGTKIRSADVCASLHERRVTTKSIGPQRKCPIGGDEHASA